MNTALEILIQEIRPKLKDYLELMGVQVNNMGRFRSITPGYDTSGNNCAINPKSNGTLWRSFSENIGGDIFTACRLLENKPTSGPEFITETVFYLAGKLSIPYDSNTIVSDDLLKSILAKNLLESVAGTFIDHCSFDHAIERGWNEDVCKTIGIGSIKPTLLQEILKGAGFNNQLLNEYAIDQRLFNEHYLTITLRDHVSRVVGFIRRDINWRPDRKNPDGTTDSYPAPKYYNSPESRIYHKDELVVGLHLAKDKYEPLYIYEGIGSWIKSIQHGLTNACCVCGTSFTEGQILRIRDCGFKKIILCFDSDEAGRNGMQTFLDKHIKLLNDIEVNVVELPTGEGSGENDAEWFIGRYGIEALKALPIKDMFDWRINRMDMENKDQVAEEMIKYIAADSQRIRWDKKIKQLSDVTNISFELILKDIESLVDGERQRKSQQRQQLIKSHMDAILRSEEPQVETANLLEQLDGIVEEELSNPVQVEFVRNRVEYILNQNELLQRDNQVWVTGFHLLDTLFDGGIPREDCYIGLAGLPSHGKSAMFINLIVSILTNPQNEDILLYFMTIDDAVRQVIPRILACKSGIFTNKIKAPAGRLDAEERLRYAEAKEWLLNQINNGRLVMTDQGDGNTIDFARAKVRWLRRRYKNRRILFFLDNFHKLTGPAGDRREKVISDSDKLQNMKTAMELTVITAMELNKGGHGDNTRGDFIAKPRLKDLSESGKLEYDTNAIGLVYTEMQARRDNARYYWLMETADGRSMRMPILEVNWAKNKISGTTANLYYEFDIYRCRMRETSEQVVIERAHSNDSYDE